MISFESKGNFNRTENFLKRIGKRDIYRSLSTYAQQGVSALASATPTDSGLASTSWSYEGKVDRRSASITWLNHDIENGFPVAVMLQYGYGTGTGGYVQGRDYINPALKPIFDKIAESVWKEVTSA